MRISDLSRLTGVPVATLKFYLREGLLPPGTATARNQAVYDAMHLRRVRLIRAFTIVGRLALAEVRRILAAVDDPSVPLPAIYRFLHRAQSPHTDQSQQLDASERAVAAVDELVGRMGWEADTTRYGQETLSRILATLWGLGCDADVSFFLPFARAAEELVAAELDLLAPESETVKGEAAVRRVALDAALAVLCEIARESQLVRRFPGVESRP